MDLTFGSTMFELQDMWNGNYSTYPGLASRPLMAQMMKVLQFQQTYNTLLTDIVKNLVNPNATNNRIDDLVNMITEDVAWPKTCERVGENTVGQAIPGVKNATTSFISSIMGTTLPPNMDVATAADLASRMNASITF